VNSSEDDPVNIAILGTGRVGGALGAGWAEKGHRVTFGSRDPQAEHVVRQVERTAGKIPALPAAEAVRPAEVVVLATPWRAAEKAIAAAGDLTGKVLIDCINPLTEDFRHLDLGHTTSAAEQIAAWAPGARVVKAFNSVSAGAMADPWFGDENATMLYCGDDEQAKDLVRRLAEDLGFDAYDAGPLAVARYLEPFAMLYIKLAIKEGWGGDCAFKILRR
jgi:8-hydroxy-5-deazaflavin:NADPH oxidoreductase